MLRRFASLLLALCLASTAALTAVSTVSAQTPSPTPTAPAQAACPTGVNVAVAPPTAAAPTTVSVTLTPPQTVKAASAGDPQSLHLHYFVDSIPTAAGTVVPSNDPSIIHSGSLTQDLGALTAGTHTVTVVVGQFNHAACEARGASTFIVGAAAGAPTAPKSGNAGLAGSSSSALVVVLLVAVAVAVVVAARLWTPKNRP
jgi:hypothetical protein